MSFKSYHAHVYYDDRTRAAAKAVRLELNRRFKVRLGRWRDFAVGPHPTPMYQVAFQADQFDLVVPWLMQNHAGLSVFIHPNSPDDLADHSGHAMWLGRQLKLDLSIFKNAASIKAAKAVSARPDGKRHPR